MKQTQWSLAVEEAVSYSLGRGKAAAVTRESGEVAAYSLARVVGPCRRHAAPGQRENTEAVAKQKHLPQPAQPRYRHSMRGARALKITYLQFFPKIYLQRKWACHP